MRDAELSALISGVLGDLERAARIPVMDEDYLDAIPLIVRHNTNASDAVHLQDLRARLIAAAAAGAREITLVASDYRLLRAARMEGLDTLDPAAFPVEAVPSLFDS